jgi:hypothetical protein
MPTGYTYPIEEREMSLREFAIRCTRGLGVTIHQRDEDVNSPPRPPVLAAHLIDGLKRAEARLERLEGLTLEQAKKLRDEEALERRQQSEALAKSRSVLRDRYSKLRMEVETWQPPTLDHEGLKMFMLSQIDECKIDCSPPYEIPEPPPAEEWLANQIEYVREDVERCRDKIAKDAEHVKKSTAWLGALYQSLPGK